MSLNLKAPLLLLALSACGFTPLYGGDSAPAARLDMVHIANIPERAGQVLRLTLETDMHAAGAPDVERYNLTVSYAIGETGLGVQTDTSTTRNRFNGTATWSLTPIGSPATTLVSGTATAATAENIIDQQYFAVTLENDTVNQQLADEIAAQITSQVAAYFKTHPAA